MSQNEVPFLAQKNTPGKGYFFGIVLSPEMLLIFIIVETRPIVSSSFLVRPLLYRGNESHRSLCSGFKSSCPVLDDQRSGPASEI